MHICIACPNRVCAFYLSLFHKYLQIDTYFFNIKKICLRRDQIKSYFKELGQFCFLFIQHIIVKDIVIAKGLSACAGNKPESNHFSYYC